MVNGWQWSFYGYFIPILLFHLQSWSLPQTVAIHWQVHPIPHLQISHVFGIWAQGINKGFWMSSVLLGGVTESHHSSRSSDSHTVCPLCKNAQKACWCSVKKNSSITTPWFPCRPILIEEKCICKTHTQVFAFGPRHLISTDNLN